VNLESIKKISVSNARKLCHQAEKEQPLCSKSTIFFSFTHSWSSALLEKLPTVQPLKNLPAFYGT
jgi:hypothetical protein